MERVPAARSAVPHRRTPLHRRLRLRTLSSSQFHREAFSVCRDCSSSHVADYAPLLSLSFSLFLSLSLSLSLPLSLSVCLSEIVRPPADASHTARYARLSMRRTAHACPTTHADAARGALTSSAATRKSERNTGSMKLCVPPYRVPPVDLSESSAMQDTARSPRSSRN